MSDPAEGMNVRIEVRERKDGSEDMFVRNKIRQECLHEQP